MKFGPKGETSHGRRKREKNQKTDGGFHKEENITFRLDHPKTGKVLSFEQSFFLFFSCLLGFFGGFAFWGMGSRDLRFRRSFSLPNRQWPKIKQAARKIRRNWEHIGLPCLRTVGQK